MSGAKFAKMELFVPWKENTALTFHSLKKEGGLIRGDQPGLIEPRGETRQAKTRCGKWPGKNGILRVGQAGHVPYLRDGLEGFPGCSAAGNPPLIHRTEFALSQIHKNITANRKQ